MVHVTNFRGGDGITSGVAVIRGKQLVATKGCNLCKLLNVKIYHRRSLPKFKSNTYECYLLLQKRQFTAENVHFAVTALPLQRQEQEAVLW